MEGGVLIMLDQEQVQVILDEHNKKLIVHDEKIENHDEKIHGLELESTSFKGILNSIEQKLNFQDTTLIDIKNSQIQNSQTSAILLSTVSAIAVGQSNSNNAILMEEKVSATEIKKIRTRSNGKVIIQTIAIIGGIITLIVTSYLSGKGFSINM